VAKKPKKKELEFEIKLKGEDGQVIKYTEGEDDEEGVEDQENEEKPKKKAKKKKAAKIQSEETLEMLMNALKPQNTKMTKGSEEIKEEAND
jgi:hypothetical protein